MFTVVYKAATFQSFTQKIVLIHVLSAYETHMFKLRKKQRGYSVTHQFSLPNFLTLLALWRPHDDSVTVHPLNCCIRRRHTSCSKCRMYTTTHRICQQVLRPQVQEQVQVLRPQVQIKVQVLQICTRCNSSTTTSTKYYMSAKIQFSCDNGITG